MSQDHYIAELETDRDRLLNALQEIARLRLATQEGSLRVRADRIWDIATKAIRDGGAASTPRSSSW